MRAYAIIEIQWKVSTNSVFCPPVLPSTPLHTPKIEQVMHLFSDIHTSCFTDFFTDFYGKNRYWLVSKVGKSKKSVTNLKVGKVKGKIPTFKMGSVLTLKYRKSVLCHRYHWLYTCTFTSFAHFCRFTLQFFLLF